MSFVAERLHSVLAGLPRFEERPQQVQMAMTIERALAETVHAVIEAGTGSGKTMAYLIPLLAHSERAVVSTGTIALQSQLMDKDIRFLASQYGRPFQYAVAKGRMNYLCLEHALEADRVLPPAGEDRTQLDNVMTVWRSGGWDGDVSTLPFKVEGRLWRQELTASSDECHGSRCRFFAECPYIRARKKLETADIIVANHALYMTDVSTGGAILPPHKIVVFDEAHKIESAAVSAFTVQVGRYATRSLLRRVNRRLKEFPFTLEKALADADEQFLTWAEKSPPGSRRLFKDTRLLDVAHGFTEVLEQVADDIRKTPVEHLELFADTPESAKTEAAACRDSLLAQTQSLQSRWQHFAEVLSAPDASDFVQWIEVQEAGSRNEGPLYYLNSAPLDVADFLGENLWPHKTAVLTSATLATGGSMDYVKGRLGLLHSMDLALPSSFDFTTQCALYCPTGLPNPNTPNYNAALTETLVPLLQKTQGRALVLFTSYKAMREVAGLLAGADLPYPTRTQEDASRPRLLNWFRGEENPVLLATATFWEGVDIPGSTLSCVVIDRLPFAHPNDPVVQAITDRLKSQGRDWFNEYSLPNAILSLKQGFGRLIRSRQDTGIVCIMDPRLMSMPYGRVIRESLPPSPIVRSLEAKELQTLFPDK